MNLKTVSWQHNKIKLIDQTKLPGQFSYIYLDNIQALWKAIKIMKVRGAPALGAVAGLGVYLGIKDSRAENFAQFKKELDSIVNYLGSSRPTARNLFWALERVRKAALENKDRDTAAIKKLLFKEAQKIISEDMAACRRMAHYGQRLINGNEGVLTICNTGILATIDYGTALGVIYHAFEKGKRLKVYACETRPMLQGARLTTWELKRKGIDVTLICDSMAAVLMKQGRVNKVFVGADRITAGGDTANKIGTYNLAVLSRYHRIPFYVVAPLSTFDLNLSSAKGIAIEQRPSKEVTELFFKEAVAADGIKVFNPAFDVTPSSLITAIVTDKGIIKPPFRKNINKMFKRIPC